MEQRERGFERADCALDVEEVLRKVEHMYEEVRQDVAANQPETYMSTGQIKKSEEVVPGPEIADKSGEMSHMPSNTPKRDFWRCHDVGQVTGGGKE